MSYQRIIVICTEGMPATIFMRKFLSSNDQVTHIYFSHSLRGGFFQKLGKAYKLLKKKSWQFLAYKLLETSIFNLLCRIVNPSATIRVMASERGIKIGHVADVNDPTFIKEIEKTGGDILLSVYSNQLMCKELIDTPNKYAINVHGTLLPDYRGGAGYFHYLADSHSRAGATVHFIVPEADAGDIICQEELQIDPGDTVFSLHARLCEIGALAVIKALDLLQRDDFKAKKIENIQKKLYWMPNRAEMKRFHRKGRKLFTWKVSFNYLLGRTETAAKA
ncbi:MAG: hypothetical protein JSU85_03990 [Candidatus Zixiibacteriota bacterium]|nr:MAG: hypothetical protein JSU85_03990 [candidate division Zixibacteria bacterium]